MKHLKPQIFSAFDQYSTSQLQKDIISGVIVGVVALPLSLAFAIAAGVSPEKGLITAVIFGAIVAIFGGTNTQIGGPTGAFVMIVASVYAEFGLSGMILASMMGGVMQIIIGAIKMGKLFKFIPYPIMIGLNTGIAISIFSSQIKDALGLTAGVNSEGITEELALPVNLIDKWITYFNHIETFDLVTIFITLSTIGVILLVPKILKKFPPYLFAVLLISIIAYFVENYAGIAITTIGDRFSIAGSLTFQPLEWPDMETLERLFPSAITIAVMGSIVSIVSCSVADGATGDKQNSDMQLVAEGIGNIVTPMFGGIPATGAVARTMVGISNGGRTPLVGIVHSVVVLAILLFLGSLAEYIPTACLAGMLIVVAYNMSNIPSIKQLLKNSKSDMSVLLTTISLAVIFNLSIAVQISVLMAMVLFMRRVAETSQISAMRTPTVDLHEGTDIGGSNKEQLEVNKGVEVFELDGPFFFGMANKFDEEMRIMGDKPKVRVLRMRKVPFIDSSGMHNLEMFLQKSKKEHIQIILSGVRPEVYASLEKNKLDLEIGREFIFDHIDEAMKKANSLV